ERGPSRREWTMWGRRKVAALTVSILLLVPASASAATFSNTSPVTINDGLAATPYPSTIEVSGLPLAAKVRVSMNLKHDAPADFDGLLVGPGGQSTILMSDTCSGSNLPGTDFTFDDAAATTVPNGCSGGTFKPTDVTPGDPFDPPAPAGPYQ